MVKQGICLIHKRRMAFRQYTRPSIQGSSIPLDPTKGMLHEAEKIFRANGHQKAVFGQVDAENNPLPDDSVDVVTCCIAANHFPTAERFIGEVYRVLKTGRLLILIDDIAIVSIITLKRKETPAI